MEFAESGLPSVFKIEIVQTTVLLTSSVNLGQGQRGWHARQAVPGTTQKEMDPNHNSFPNGLNMLNDDLDLSRQTETKTGLFGSAVTPTLRPQKGTGHLRRHMKKCMSAHGQAFFNMKLAEIVHSQLQAQALILDDWYLEAQFDAYEDKKKFDLLLWWKTYSYRYPVLSHLARDVLVIPVSTVSSEQAFSMSGRIIEPRRSCLTLEMVEILTCVQDYEHSRKRLQNETVDEEFLQNFFSLFIDESSGSNQVQN
ncbi:hypothetical protein Dsin_030875 [Dipteronia sinensis]|uniref:HAT C-terminal dimerisation domain-containing protein n=1 Tax=Dipteronia sinensis TaxID=43782 RepID=A0AAE0DRT7_9ROSI|nr:hypothetical protein Dsin_030875 [Dipteronia sinensis]